MQWNIGTQFLFGLTVVAVSPANLCAAPSIDEFKTHLGSSISTFRDDLLFMTNTCKVLVLADKSGNIGAILMQGKTEDDKVNKTLDAIIDALDLRSGYEVRYGREENAALILFNKIARKQASGNKEIVAVDRLSAIYNVCTSATGEWHPYRWHNGGFAFRLYRNMKANDVLAEVTLDLTERRVPYAEIRLLGKQSKLKATNLANHDYGVPTNRQQLRELSNKLGDSTPISSNKDNDTHLCSRYDVFSVGYSQRLREANERRRNTSGSRDDKVNLHIFPDFVYPSGIANLRTKDDAAAPDLKLEKADASMLPLQQVNEVLGVGTATGQHLHSWAIEKCQVMALLEGGTSVGAFLITSYKEAAAPALAARIAALFPNLETPTPISSRDGKCCLLVYPGKVCSTFLTGNEHALVIRSLLSKKKMCDDLQMNTSHLKLTLDLPLYDEKLTFVLDLSAPRADKIHIVPTENSTELEKEMCSLLNLVKPTSLQKKDQSRINEAVNGKVIYAERGPNIFLTLGNKSRYYTAGKLRHVQESNQQANLVFPRQGNINRPSQPTTLPEPTKPEPLPSQTTPQPDKTDNAPSVYTPQQARDAYVDYLNKI